MGVFLFRNYLQKPIQIWNNFLILQFHSFESRTGAGLYYR
jgi:hypothetical protein